MRKKKDCVKKLVVGANDLCGIGRAPIHQLTWSQNEDGRIVSEPLAHELKPLLWCKTTLSRRMSNFPYYALGWSVLIILVDELNK
jgi:hypothetical protein